MEDDYDSPEIRPLPAPPRCRGIPLGNDAFTGCAYGFGDMPPYTGRVTARSATARAIRARSAPRYRMSRSVIRSAVGV
jgi:hypothetical protein